MIDGDSELPEGALQRYGQSWFFRAGGFARVLRLGDSLLLREKDRMAEQVTLNNLLENLNLFHKMNDAVRPVDPIRKRVLEYCGNSAGETCERCFAYWGNGRICENCISVRAHRGQKSFIKLEHARTRSCLSSPCRSNRPGHPWCWSF